MLYFVFCVFCIVGTKFQSQLQPQTQKYILSQLYKIHKYKNFCILCIVQLPQNTSIFPTYFVPTTQNTHTQNFFMFSNFVLCLLCFLTSLLKNIIYFLHNYKILCVLCFRKNIFSVYCLYDFCYTNISVLCFKKIKFSALKFAIV